MRPANKSECWCHEELCSHDRPAARVATATGDKIYMIAVMGRRTATLLHAGMGLLVRVIVYLWASPVTLLGMLFLIVSKLTGGGGHFHSGVWEAWGGWPGQLLRSGLPFAGSVAAITIGHVVLGVSERAINETRAHERVHVQQYEWWGVLFLLAYPAAGAWAWARGGDPYLDNPFECAGRDLDEKRI
jgi:hypothetical protein